MKNDSGKRNVIGSHNHGTEKDGAARVPYGRDNSSWNGAKSKERGDNIGGSPTNLSHSLSGTSANQGRSSK